MWYEILPSFAIVSGCFLVPHITCYFINLLGYGKPYKRALKSSDDFLFWRRDDRITGNVYKQKGLECIPD